MEGRQMVSETTNEKSDEECIDDGKTRKKKKRKKKGLDENVLSLPIDNSIQRSPRSLTSQTPFASISLT